MQYHQGRRSVLETGGGGGGGWGGGGGGGGGGWGGGAKIAADGRKMSLKFEPSHAAKFEPPQVAKTCSWGSGGRCKPPSGVRGEAPGAKHILA